MIPAADTLGLTANLIPNSLPSLVKRAADQLASAASAAEVLDARDMASVAYDASKKAARLARAKGAHDELIAKAHRAQADALLIESEAKRRLADEYDAAQERGEVGVSGFRSDLVRDVDEVKPVASDVFGSREALREARIIRDAERASPGIAQRAIEARLAQGQEPTKAALREAVIEAARQGLRGGSSGRSNKNPLYEAPTPAGAAWSHVYGTCRALAEWATNENLLLANQGRFERHDDQSLNVSAVRRAIAALGEFERLLDAH